jgi:ABC-type branched-subunit amino acid transport system substrate-binding protein
MVVLLIVGLGIGAGVGYFAAPKGGETVVEVPVEVPVEVNPLDGAKITMGATTTLTSDLETYVPLCEDIWEVDYNDYLSHLGYDITTEVLVEDNQGTPAIALEKTQGFKAAGVNLVMGHGRSSHCQASMAYANENDMLLVSRSSTSPLLSIEDDNLFRTCPNDYVQAPAIAEMWEGFGAKAILIINRAGAYGDGLYNLLTEELKDRGIDELGRIRYAIEMEEFSSYIENINQILEEAKGTYGGLEFLGIHFIGSTKQITFLTQCADYDNIMDVQWMACESAGRDQRRLDDAGELFVQIQNFSSFMGADEGSAEWQSMEARFNDMTGLWPSFYHGTQYDAQTLTLMACLDTGTANDAPAVIEILLPLSGTLHGTTGQLTLAPTGDREPTVFDIWGYYEEEGTGDYKFRKFGWYDGRTIEVKWDDAALLEYCDITRPGVMIG